MKTIYKGLAAVLPALVLAGLLAGCGQGAENVESVESVESAESMEDASSTPEYAYLAEDWYLFGLAYGQCITLNADGTYTRYSAGGEEVTEEGAFTVWDDGNGTQVIGLSPQESAPKEGAIAEDENSFRIHEYGMELIFVRESAMDGWQPDGA